MTSPDAYGQTRESIAGQLSILGDDEPHERTEDTNEPDDDTKDGTR